MLLKIKATYVHIVNINNISVLVLFNVKNTNAGDFKKGDIVTKIEITDESGDWVKVKQYVFIKSEHGTFNAKQMRIELVDR